MKKYPLFTNKICLILCFHLCIIFLLNGCGPLLENALDRNRSGDKGRKFGATYMTMNNPYFGVLNDNIKEVVESNGDFLITRDPAQDQEKQNEQIYDMIEEGVEAIFLNPVDRKEVEPALKACHEAGIPVFNVDTLTSDTEYVTSVIASDNYNAGVQCARDMMSKLEKGEIIILDHPIVSSINERIQGFLDTIEGNENYIIVAREAAGGELEVAMEVMNTIIRSNISCDVVMGGNDPTALGALAALEANHMDEDILIYGVDGSPDAKAMIREGYLEGTSAQSPRDIGRIAAETAYAYLNGEEIRKNIVIPVTLITKENMDSFDISGWQ